MKNIAQGAEAVIYQEKTILKERKPKGYRLQELDAALRKFRTGREAKVLEKLAPLGFVPRLISTDKDKALLEMELVKGKNLSEALEKVDYGQVSREIGRKIAQLHSAGIIHGDLTTSNMIVGEQVVFIDFGLSFFSEKVEDKAVDLHVFREALEAKHYTIWKEVFENALEAYRKEAKDGDKVIERLEEVEKRGRYKAKY